MSGVDMGKRLLIERQRLGVTQAEFAEWGGVKRGSQAAYEKGETPFTSDYLAKLQGRGVDLGFVLNGKREVGFSPGSMSEILGRQTVQATSGSVASAVAMPITDVGTGDLVAIDEIDLAYGLGASFADGPVRVRQHEISRALLRTMTASSPANLTLARGVGDSMEPSIYDGDIVLIDRSQQFQQDAIMALSVGELAMIKRVRRDGSRVQLLSDNQRIPPYEVDTDEVNLVGRIVFVGRNI